MNTQRQEEVTIHEVEVQGACAACGGPVSARFAPGSAQGVCLACHLLTGMLVVRAGEGLRIVQAPAGEA